MQNPKKLTNGKLILYGYRGSIAHNTHISEGPYATDDIDTIGIFVGSPEYYLGFGGKEVIESFIGDEDIVLYEIKKFFNLAKKSNPNALQLLWNKSAHILEKDNTGQMLIDNRNLFLSKMLYASYKGYATAQLKRLKYRTLNGYKFSKRQALLDEFGYDIKYACHLIRLLKMGIEALDGKINVFRDDWEELLEIKTGVWKLEKVMEYSEHLFNELDLAHKKSTLSEKPDLKRIETLLMDCIWPTCNQYWMDKPHGWADKYYED